MSTQSTASGIELVDFDPELEQLLAQHSERLPFLHPAWLRAWLAEFGGNVEPVFLTCNQGEVIGIAPLMRDGL